MVLGDDGDDLLSANDGAGPSSMRTPRGGQRGNYDATRARLNEAEVDAMLVGVDDPVTSAQMRAAVEKERERYANNPHYNNNDDDDDDGGAGVGVGAGAAAGPAPPPRRQNPVPARTSVPPPLQSGGSSRAGGEPTAAAIRGGVRKRQPRRRSNHRDGNSGNRPNNVDDVFEGMDEFLNQQERAWFILPDLDPDGLDDDEDANERLDQFLEEMHERDLADGLTDVNGEVTRMGLQLIVNAIYNEFCPSDEEMHPDNVRKWYYSHFTEDRLPADTKPEFRDLFLRHDDTRIVDAQRIRAIYSLRQTYVGTLHYQMIKRQMSDRKSEGLRTNAEKISYICEFMTYCYMNIETEHLGRALASDDARDTIPERVRVYYFKHMQQMEADDTPYMQLVIHILNQLHMCGYRRRGEMCYEQIITADGHKTRAWQEKISIEQFIVERTAKDRFAAQWKNLMASQNNLSSLTKWLKICREPEFAELEPDRHIFSFRNGIYFASLDRFLTYEQAQFSVQRHVTAAKYFDFDFDDSVYERPVSRRHPRSNREGADADADAERGSESEDDEDDDDETLVEDPLLIPTPNASKIIDTQKLGDDVAFYLWALMGRSIFKVGELDNWQMIPFIKGLAGTGKSTFGRILAQFYNRDDIAIIGNSFEERFGLESIHDKLLCLCYEMSNKIPLSQTDMQSMASGEEMLVPRKFKAAITCLWATPSFFFGNRIGKWLDTSGSVQRRLPTFEFFHTVKESDPNLQEKMRKEMPNIIRKAVKCYLQLAREHGKHDFWSFCPQYFVETRNNLRKMVNPFHAFMEEGDNFIYDPDAYVQQEIVRNAFYEFCRNNNITKVNFDGDVYEEEFGRRGISIRKKMTLMWKERVRRAVFFVGFTIKIDDARQDGSHRTGIFGFKKNLELQRQNGNPNGAGTNGPNATGPPAQAPARGARDVRDTRPATTPSPSRKRQRSSSMSDTAVPPAVPPVVPPASPPHSVANALPPVQPLAEYLSQQGRPSSKSSRVNVNNGGVDQNDDDDDDDLPPVTSRQIRARASPPPTSRPAQRGGGGAYDHDDNASNESRRKRHRPSTPSEHDDFEDDRVDG